MSRFRTGADAAAAAQKSGGFSKTQFLSMEDGEEVYLRFLTDAYEDDNYPHIQAWITVDQHAMVPTKQKPDDWGDRNWPKTMGAVCRKDPAFDNDECYICELKDDKGKQLRRPSPRLWALACLRELVYGDGSEELGGPEAKGKVVGIRDKTREVTIPAREAKDGKPAREEQTVTEKAIVVVNLGWRNFFSPLQGFANQYGTVLDRDYWVKRQGANTDTTYQIVPRDPLQRQDGSIYDLRDPEIYKLYESDYDLEEIITGMASDEFYAKFFDPRVTVDKEGNVVQTGAPVEQQAKPEGDVDPDKLQALAERVKGHQAAPESQQPVAAGGGGVRALD